jgi:hypothetical protein
MSILSSLSTKIVVGSLAIVGGIGGVSALASTNPTIQTDLSNVKAAITSKDLSAFKTAQTQLINDKAKTEIDRVNSTTQDQLNEMSDRQVKQQAVQDAIKNNDYNEFKSNADTRILEKVNSQEAFDKLVAAEKIRAEQITKIDDAIKNNDSLAYIAAVKALAANKPTDTNNANRPARPTPTDAQIQAQFDKLVAAYKADGSLPSQNDRMMGFGGGMGMKGGRGHGGSEGKMNRGGNI